MISSFSFTRKSSKVCITCTRRTSDGALFPLTICQCFWFGTPLPGQNKGSLQMCVENSVLLKCRKLRREDQETSDWIVSRIPLFYDMSLVSVVIEISILSNLQGVL